MKVLTENPLIKENPHAHRDQLIADEIQAFISCGAQYAELWFDPEEVSIQYCVDLYRKELRRRRIDSIEVHQRLGKVVVIKKG